jgi:hypothetical protein
MTLTANETVGLRYPDNFSWRNNRSVETRNDKRASLSGA